MIKLLELPTLQLEQRVKQEIEENPVLEEEQQTAEESTEDNGMPKEVSMEEYLKEAETPAYKSYVNNYSRDDKARQVVLFEGMSMHEYLTEQLSYREMPQEQFEIARYIIGNIDDDGYLRLELQLERRSNLTAAQVLAKRILENCFTEFTKKHFEKIMGRLGISEEQFRAAIEEIQRLSPKPGNLYNEGGNIASPYVIPDFILDERDGELMLRLNSYNVPELKINRKYADMIRQMAHSSGNPSQEDKEALQFVKNKIDSAKWFISAIKQRQDTLMRTMQAIVDYQREYFLDGNESKLKPMILKDIADMTGLDVSTISRVVNSKYVQTGFGIISLKQLFSEAMQTDSGEEVSSYEIKNILSECIDREDKRKPLTDEALMEILNNMGYHIARRTVAKYREMLGIPVARLRKEL